MQDCENTPGSESMAYLTLLYSTYPGGLSSSTGGKTAVGSIGQCNGEYEQRLLKSRIRS